MADRPVYETRKDNWGNIVVLGGDFGAIGYLDAISEIERGLERYFVPLQGGAQAPVEVRQGAQGKYLRANWDRTERNNLVDLPDL